MENMQIRGKTHLFLFVALLDKTLTSILRGEKLKSEVYPRSHEVIEKKCHLVTWSRSFKVTQQKNHKNTSFHFELSHTSIFSISLSQMQSFGLRKHLCKVTLQNARGYNSITWGQIELIFPQLNSGPKITLYTNFEQKVRDEGVIWD